MHKNLCKISASPFSILCYHICAVIFSDNVHFRISLRETLLFADSYAFSRRKYFASRGRSLNLRLACKIFGEEEKLYGDVSFQTQI